MTLLWSTPRDWQTKEPITKTKLNTVSDQLKHLYNPNRVIMTNRGTIANLTTTATSFADMDYSNMALSLEMTGSRDLTINLLGQAFNNTLGTFTYFDFYMDNTTYLSSLTGTSLATGLHFVHHTVATHYVQVNARVVIPKGLIAPGVHVFSPQWRVSGGTATWVALTAHWQYFIGEIS